MEVWFFWWCKVFCCAQNCKTGSHNDDVLNVQWLWFIIYAISRCWKFPKVRHLRIWTFLISSLRFLKIREQLINFFPLSCGKEIDCICYDYAYFSCVFSFLSVPKHFKNAGLLKGKSKSFSGIFHWTWKFSTDRQTEK